MEYVHKGPCGERLVLTREPNEEEMRLGHELVAAGWLQVSRAYRTVARLPNGSNGNQALVWALQKYAEGEGRRARRSDIEWAESLPERSAASQFMRCYTDYPFAQHLQRELTIYEFIAFRKAGGRAA